VAKKDRKKKRKSAGQTMSGMRAGLKGLVGTGSKQKKKESLASKIITWALLAAAVALLIYRFTR